MNAGANDEKGRSSRFERVEPATEALDLKRATIIEEEPIADNAEASRAEKYLKTFKGDFPATYIISGLFLALVTFEARVVYLAAQAKGVSEIFNAVGSLFLVLPVLWFIAKMVGWNSKNHLGDRVYEEFIKTGKCAYDAKNIVRRRFKRNSRALELIDSFEASDEKVIKAVKDEAFTSAVMMSLSRRNWLDRTFAVRGYYRISKIIVEKYDRSFSTWFFILAMRNFMLSGFINEFSGFAEDMTQEMVGAMFGNVVGKIAGVSNAFFIETYVNYKLFVAFGMYLVFITRPIPFDVRENDQFLNAIKIRLSDFN
ncbi:MAG: hypothetical protein PHF29_10445, partial [Candidatus Riflebacteria bacterium]|nr:hypothetical protein [Candidatus Riflebacteria bacterium]